MSDGVTQDITNMINNLRRHSQAAVGVSNFMVPSYPALGIYDATSLQSQGRFIERLNASLAEILSSSSGCYLLDINQIASRAGKEQFVDSRMYYVSRAPYSQSAFLSISREMLKFIKVIKGRTRKCIVLDCDNTLWGGIIGEDGIDGIKLGPDYPGACFREFQKQLLNLTRKGFILAINSQNNSGDVMAVLKTHPHQILREEHFACIQVNWENKADNMRAIAAALNLGTDSLIFFDDNPVECKLIEDNLPEVLTVQMPQDPIAITGLLNEIDELEVLSLTEEDKKRPELYRGEARRQQLQTSATSLEDFYASLKMEMEVWKKPSGEIPRLAQLTQRTNQFNLTTHRYSEAEIKRFIESNAHELYAFNLKDIFGNSGLVGEAILSKTEPSTYEIDTLLMSCRVIGRTAEETFVSYCLEGLKNRGVKKVIARYIPTKKNALVEKFYDHVGFHLISQTKSGEKVYEIALEDLTLPPHKWIKVIEK